MKLLTFGVFDILHIGHIHFLEKASTYGDVIVGLADDASIKTLKGDARPIIPDYERESVLRSIRYVHDVHPFSFTEDTYMQAHRAVIEHVSPDIFAQGSQAKHGFLPILEDFQLPILTIDSLERSTTEIIEKIRQNVSVETYF